MGDTLTEGIAAQALPILQGLGYDLVDLELAKEGGDWFLRFFIEFPAQDLPIGIDDCERASAALSDWLDEADPIPHAYFLEVSSPGIERPLKKESDFVRFRGQPVRIGTYMPVHGGKTHVGLLGPVTNESLTLILDDREITIGREQIASARLHWEEDKEW